MSHIVTIQSQLRDPAAIAAACQRLGLAAPVHGKAQLYAGQTAEGLLVQFPGWKYPIAIDTESGQVHHDHFGGALGRHRGTSQISASVCRRDGPHSGKEEGLCRQRAAASGRQRAAPNPGGHLTMTAPHRRIVSPPAPAAPISPRRQQQHQKLRARLEQERRPGPLAETPSSGVYRG